MVQDSVGEPVWKGAVLSADSSAAVRASQTFKMAEVAKHASEHSFWVVVHGVVYDITKWIDSHPGGSTVFKGLGGTDITDQFEAFHHPTLSKSKSYLKAYKIGTVTDPPKVNAFQQDFRKLRQRLIDSGKFVAAPSKTMLRAAYQLPMFFAALWTVWMFSSNPLIQIFVGGSLLGCFWQQAAFNAHDAGHSAVTHSQSFDETMGCTLFNLLGGVSSGWWRDSHYTHHVYTNSVDMDPDIQHPPVLAVSEAFVANDAKGLPVWSSYHGRSLVFGTIGRFIVRYQHYLFYPVMAIARFNLYAQGLIFLAKHPKWHLRTAEFISIAGFFVWMGLLVSNIEGGWNRVLFLVWSHALAGVMHVQITISHFSMDTYAGTTYKDMSWQEMQLATSMDVLCPSWMDWFHGGLQFQVIHHLFPIMPRHHLRSTQAEIIKLCAKHGVKYHALPFLACNKHVLSHMAAIGRKCKDFRSLLESPLVDGFFARG